MAREDARPETVRTIPIGAGNLLFPLAAGGALVAYNSKLAIGAGGLTLVAAAFYKKDWSWWIVGVLILVIGLVSNGIRKPKGNEPFGTDSK